MNSAEKFCLRWNDFQQNITTVFGALKDDTEFADVTLACEDGQQVEAHKVILAASSPFFQNLLRKNKHPHPLIFMRGVKEVDLRSVIDYVYYGEANVMTENLENFMQVAHELQLKGLIRGVNFENDDAKPNKKFMQTNPFVPEKDAVNYEVEKVEALSDFEDELNDTSKEEEPENCEIGYERESDITLADPGNLADQIKAMIGLGQTMGGKQKNNVCKVCGKEGTYGNIRNHIEVKHMEGIALPCDLCGDTFTTRRKLTHHRKTSHTAI